MLRSTNKNSIRKGRLQLITFLVVTALVFTTWIQADANSVYAANTAKQTYTIKFNPAKGKVSKKKKVVKSGKKYGNLPTPKRSGYGFIGWYTKKKGGKKVTKVSTVKTKKNRTLYAKWGKKYKIKFNANKGTVKKKSKTVVKGKKYGSLPTPKRTNYYFTGWYTKKSGGSKITSSKIVKTNKNRTLYAHYKKQTKVACVGASIVYGTGISNRTANSYPAKLQKKLGNTYAVNNYGKGGRTIRWDTGKAYLDSTQFSNSMALKADRVFVLMGTNDTKYEYWNFGRDNDIVSPNAISSDDEKKYEKQVSYFIDGYMFLLSRYAKSTPKSKIYAMTLPKIITPNGRHKTFNLDLLDAFNEAIKNETEKQGYNCIDVNSQLEDDMTNYLSDGVHLSAQGAEKLSALAYEKFK